jgi:hypothetical protein
LTQSKEFSKLQKIPATSVLLLRASSISVMSYHGGYEIDPYGSNGSASKSDSAESYDYGGGENGTL